ncbi:MAG: RDD family protein [Thermoanaerobaculales bacterium]|nr:RDD family protein [Thermoanaerobaculales bacterium]
MRSTSPPAISPPISAAPSTEPAGCLCRLFALGLDLVLLIFVLLIFDVLLDALLEEHLSRTVLDTEGRLFETLVARYELAAWLGGSLLMLLYFSLLERSPWRGTPGKRALGCQVVRSDGRPAGLPRLLWRNLMKLLSAAPCFLGFALAAVTPGRQALHDFLSGCRVVGRR